MCAEHVWLSEIAEVASGPEKFEALQEALAKQTNLRAMSANEALVRTFHDLAADLMGEPFVQQLTRPTQARYYSTPHPDGDTQTTQMALLQQANERLILAALRAESVAETAINNCNDLIRISQDDALTGTPNRTLLLDRLERSISLANRQNTRVAVLFLDLDWFKQINDTQGHSVGDEVLRLTARCLESAARDSDSICRYGEDEFLMLLPQITQVSDALRTATKMLTALAECCWIGSHRIDLSASLGIAVYPEDGEDTTTLINCADAAMYRAKRLGGGRLECHSNIQD